MTVAKDIEPLDNDLECPGVWYISSPISVTQQTKVRSPDDPG
jgi:hypothetical protein